MIKKQEILYLFLCMKIDFVLANNADADEMAHSVAFHLRFFCSNFIYNGLKLNVHACAKHFYKLFTLNILRKIFIFCSTSLGTEKLLFYLFVTLSVHS